MPTGCTFSQPLLDRIDRTRVIAVLMMDQVEDAVPLARALLAGGIDIMELTLRTPAAIECVRRIKGEEPRMVVGVGTILTPEQVSQVVKAGGDFGVSPGTNPRVLKAASDAGFAFGPGVATPSDIEQSLEFGCRLLKLFPCEQLGGLTYLKTIAAPYAHLGVKYIPLGGLNAQNAGTYLKEPSVRAIGGSWIAPRELITAHDWKKIEANAREAVGIVTK